MIRTAVNQHRVSGVMSATTLPRGCKQDDRNWLALCEPHLVEWLDTHRVAGDAHWSAKAEPEGARKDEQ